MSTTPTIPLSFSFRCLQQSQLTWTITNVDGSPTSGLTVVATLYSGRSRINPTLVPGTADSVFNNIAMPETPVSSGIYIGTIPNTFNPAAVPGFVANQFVVVITASSGASVLETWTIPAVVVPAQGQYDLVLLDDVKAWLNMPLSNTNDDLVLQILISSFSDYVRQRTGRNNLSQIVQYTEIYDGNGNNEIFLRNPPIQSLISCTIGGYAVPFSPATNVAGVYITQELKSIAFRNSGWQLYPPSSIYPYCFTPGKGNVQVTYTGGYETTPWDLYEVAMKVCALNYKRKDWIDLAAKNLGVTGSTGGTRYRDWARPPECEEVLLHYQRWARS